MFYIGQRWYSEAEPELGLGIITQVENKIVQIFFAEVEAHRSYGIKTAPLKRFKLEVGDPIICIENGACEVVNILINNELFIYQTKSGVVPETKIIAQINISGPLDRLAMVSFDGPQFFNLRYQAYLAYRQYQSFSLKGFLGAKINFIPHQVYICDEVLKMDNPKVMLCDEVGLGKTIESGIILHSLYQKELIGNCLIIVPDSLTNQWFIELYKKFSLNFSVHSADEYESIEMDKSQRYIVSTKLIKEDENYYQKLKEYNWDCIIVDESHQIPFFDQENSLTKLITQLNQDSYCTLFLSATPEILGIENLFFQLHILDPLRYPSLDKFKTDQKSFEKVSHFLRNYLDGQVDQKQLDEYISPEEQQKHDRNEIARLIVDRYGSGRNYFRNSRSHLEKFAKLFTKRKLNEYAIELKGKLNDSVVLKAKTNCLLDVIEKIGDKKLFVICQSKQIIHKIQQELLAEQNFKIALFHSDQSLLERDRQAAYFADPEGAQILLATQIGSEGRNFEFAHHMFMFDLPKLPDQLEQRIGRLDRIGQLNDVNIHIPFIKHTFEETLFRWFDQVLGAFSEFPKGGNNFYQIHQNEIKTLLENEFDQKSVDDFVVKFSSLYADFKNENERNHDLLLEIRSYHPTTARSLIQTIEKFEAEHPCLGFLEDVFEQIGVEIEQLNPQSYFIKPSDNMLIPSYPGLLNEGMGLTFDRDYANHHQNVDFVSWEHPIVKTAIELTLNSSLGNLTIISTNSLPRNIYFEFIVTLQCSDKYKYEAGMYLPFTPLRVLLDIKGTDFTNKITKKAIDGVQISTPTAEQLEQLKMLPKDLIKNMSSMALEMAKTRSKKYQVSALEELKLFKLNEIERIKSILKNQSDLSSNLDYVEKHFDKLEISIKSAKLQLDCLRIILPQD